jgi:tetratricopeptide (TPR) repeat protein
MDDPQPAKALHDLNKVIRLTPFNASAYFNRAILEGNTDDFDDAITDYDKVIALNPNSILAYYNRGGIKYKSGDLKGALSDYNKTIELYPEFADAYYNRSLIKIQLKDIRGAREDYKKVDEIQRMSNSKKSLDYSEGIRMMKILSLNDDFSTKNDLAEKIQYKQINIQLLPIFSITYFPDFLKNTRVYDTRGKAHYNIDALTLTNKDSVDIDKVREKIAVLDASIKKDPDDISAYLQRAELNTSIDNYNLSFSDYDHALSIDSNNALVYFSRANTRFKFLEHMMYENVPEVTVNKNAQGNTLRQVIYDPSCKMMIHDYSKTLDLDPGFTYAWFNMANAKFFLGDYHGAILDFSGSIIGDPGLSEAYYNRGLVSIFIQDNANGCADLSKAGELGILESYSIMKRFCYK